jgi:hypothetical protein
MLGLVQRGLRELMDSDATYRIEGLFNIATYGVATTAALQNLRSIDRAAFDEWYAPEEARFKADPICKYFWNYRSRVLKEANATVIEPKVTIAAGTVVGMKRIAADMPAAPPGATGFKFGDDLGGNGWVIEMPDGSQEMFYVDVPPDYPIKTTLHFETPRLPDGHEDDSVQALAQHYVGKLEGLVDRAKRRFG